MAFSMLGTLLRSTLFALAVSTLVCAEDVENKWTLVVHGGGSSPATLTQQRIDEATSGIRKALKIGAEQLRSGAAALDVVEQTVRVLEDDPAFNAGRGAKMTIAGEFELDASIMCGKTSRAGGVAGIRTVANPISVARGILEDGRHVLLCAEGAELFAAESLSIQPVTQDYFFNEKVFQKNQLRRAELGLAPLPHPAKEPSEGTVGAVALDVHGNVAAATSTGGRTGKLPGRIGDSPIIGAGTYAKNGVGAISCTGKGEEFIRHAAAMQPVWLAGHTDLPLKDAVKRVLTDVLQPGDGGMIGVTSDGQVIMEFTTTIMNRGYATSDGRLEVSVEARP